jgi:hypothetical protein
MTKKVILSISNLNNKKVKVSIISISSPEPSELPMPPSNWLTKK